MAHGTGVLSFQSETYGPANLSFADGADVRQFVETLERFERGELDADAWRAFRLLNGTYGQRQEGEWSMLRAKLPQGLVSAAQLEVLAEVADRYSRGFCHVTTRQNVQFHFVRLSQMGEAMAVLADAGMTTREACGNSVRSITTSATAGIAPDELFDVTPYARALTRYFLRRTIATTLPRKFKMAFSAGGRDDSYVLVNDVGFSARFGEDGARGFRMTVGGGTALMCNGGLELFAFLPADRIAGATEAVLRVFHARGDRVNRKKNRMKFLIKQMGWPSFREAVLAELAAIEASGFPVLTLADDDHRVEAPPARREPAPTHRELAELVAAERISGPGITPRYLPTTASASYQRFFATNVLRQKQAGFAMVTVVAPIGDLSSGRLRALAVLARAYGDGTVRFTIGQNVTLRWVPLERLAELHAALDSIGLASTDPESIADVASCPGAETCKLAVTQSRGLAESLSGRFAENFAAIDGAAGLRVRVSGCPNGCGLHHVAGLGFQGGLRKIDGRPVPQYHVYAGGRPDGAAPRFGRVIGKVPARRIGAVIERLAALYQSQRAPGEDMAEFLGRAELATLRSAIADLEKLDAADATPEDFVDLGEAAAFAPATTEGECAA